MMSNCGFSLSLTILVIQRLCYISAQDVAGCSLPLGLENNTITDTQLSASSEYSSSYSAAEARLNTGRGWGAGRGGNTEYLQIDLLTQHEVSGYTIQGSTIGWYTKTLAMYHSLDGLVWKRYVTANGEEVLQGSAEANSPRRFQLQPVISTRYLAIQPLTTSGRASLRLELHGCPLDQQTPTRHTVVPTAIQDKQEWIPSQNPYVINSEVRILATGHVTIQPGVKVIFNHSDASLSVLGRLDAVGLTGLPVVFTHSFPVKSHKSLENLMWKQIQVFHQSNLTLQYCVISGARTGITGPLSAMTIRHCQIEHNDQGVELTDGDPQDRIQFLGTFLTKNRRGIYGAYWDEGKDFYIGLQDSEVNDNDETGVTFYRRVTVTARNCKFLRNKQHGLFAYYFQNVLISDSHFIHNGREGFYIENSGSENTTVVVTRSVFKSNGHNGIHVRVSGQSTGLSVAVTESDIGSNGLYGVRLNGYMPNNMEIILRDSHFLNNEYEGIYLFGTFYNNKVTINIDNNTLMASAVSYRVLTKISPDSISGTLSKAYVRNNTFSVRQAFMGNGKEYMSFVLQGNRFNRLATMDGLSLEGKSVEISDNEFVNCTTTNVIHTKSLYTRITNNVFINPEAKYDVLVETPFAELSVVNASHNYWGNSDMMYARSRICDFYCDVSKQIAVIHPHYTTETMDQLSSDTDSNVFSQTEDSIGGMLTESVTIQDDAILTVDRSIFIPEGISLTVSRNTTLRFSYKQGILVKGNLSMKGDKSRPVQLVSGNSEKIQWGGLIVNGTGLSVDHVVVKDAGTGLTLKSNESGSVSLTDVTITNCDSAIAVFTWSNISLLLQTVMIDKCPKWLDVQKLSAYKLTLNITESVIRDNSGVTLYSLRPGEYFEFNIMNSIITSTRRLFQISACSSNVKFYSRDSKFSTSGSTPLFDISGEELDMTFFNVSFVKSYVTLTACTRYNRQNRGAITVQDSTFNNELHGDALILTKKWGHRSIFHDAKIINNTFRTRDGYSGIRMDVSGEQEVRGNRFDNCALTLGGKFDDVVIENNTFLSKSTALKLRFEQNNKAVFQVLGNQIHGGTLWLSSDVQPISVLRNTFNRSTIVMEKPNIKLRENTFLNGSDFDVKFQGSGYSGSVINCTFNYWGTADSQEIAGRIFDASNDETLPVIEFVPYYANSNMTDPQFPVHSFISSDGTIGGRVGGKVTLDVSGSPYIVNSNIQIAEKEELVIEAGVALLFPKGLGINVVGSLKVQGNKTHPVLGHPQVIGEKWSGIRVEGQLYRPNWEEPQIRLVDGSEPREGRLEIKVNGTWGTVCDDGFDVYDAKVVCFMLGYMPETSHNYYFGAKFGEGSGPIHLGYLGCRGSEQNLMDCSSSQFSCGHREDVGVRCNGDILPLPEDIGNAVELSHLSINDTENGLELRGNVTFVDNVVSSYSETNGITVNVARSGVAGISARNLEAAFNRKSGIAVVLGREAQPHVYPAINISGCNFSNNLENGVFVEYYTKIVLTNCHFVENTDRAVQLTSDSKLQISKSIFLRNGKGVVQLNVGNAYSKKALVEVTDSQILEHDLTTKYPKHLMYLNSRYLTSCEYRFKNNHFSRNYGNVFYFYGSANYIFLTQNNTFQHNNASLLQTTYGSPDIVRHSFIDNIVENNTPLDRKEPLMKVYYVRDTNTSLFDVSDNKFIGNTALQIMLFLQDTAEGNLKIERNRFEDNSVNVTIKINFYGFHVRRNVFRNPLSAFELEVPDFDRWNEIDARWNYWGSREMEFVVRRISGFDSDMRKGFVHYLPFYLSKDMTDVYAKSHSDFWIDNLHGGLIDRFLRLDSSHSPVKIKRSILISNKGTLEIASGVDLLFDPNTGIYVNGVLLAGEGTDDVTMFPSSKVSWFGVVFPYRTASVSKTVRLADGPAENIGRVEMFVNGTWLSVCRYSGNEEALICQNLGYSREDASVTFNQPYGPGSSRKIIELGCPETASTLSQCHPKIRETSYCSIALKCTHFVAHTGDQLYSRLNRVSIIGSHKGLAVQTSTVKLVNCIIRNTEEAGIDVHLATDAVDLDLGGTVVEHGLKDGIATNTGVTLRLRNGTSRFNQGNGVTLKGALHEIIVEDMTVNNNTNGGLLAFLDIRTSKTRYLRIQRNRFENHQSGKVIDLDMYMRPTTLLFIENNEFMDNAAATINAPLNGNGYDRDSKLFILKNKITSSGPISVRASNYISVFMSDNIIKNSTGYEKCFFDLEIYNYGSQEKRNVSISMNSFEGMFGKCVLSLKAPYDQYPFNGTVDYNQIYNSRVREAAVILETRHYNFSQNIFDNPFAEYELKVVSLGEGVVSAINNWWGSVDPVAAGSRILHKEQDQRLFRVDYLPTLANQNFDCTSVNNCSGKGECVRPNGCRCDSGWSGTDCTEFDCSGVGNCHGNGVCTGPNKCRCTDGWEGSSCVVATCHGVDDCGGDQRGYCVLPDQCTCFPQYSGRDCSQCSARRWGKSCLPCPRCLHGACNTTNGVCECESVNWSGTLCDACSETYYGPDCLPYMNVMNVIPSTGPDTGGTDIHIWGHNFPETTGDRYFCQFGGQEVVNGSRISKEHVKCSTPKHRKGDVIVEISADGNEFTTNKTKFTYYEVCPPGACGKTEFPPHGHCLYGGCVCILPWTGEDCDIELKPPVIVTVEDQTVAEGNEYRRNISLREGSHPISWSIRGAPTGMTIDQRSGQLYWDRTVARGQPYVIVITAANRMGRAEMQWSLTVPMSYRVIIDQITPTGQLPRPKTVEIKGHVSFFDSSTTSLIAFVDVKIRNKHKTSTVFLMTSQSKQFSFETVYFPKADDSGVFEVDGRHPSDNGFSVQKSWNVLGMKVDPGYVHRQAYLDTDVVEMRKVAVLKNVGSGTISNITAKVEGIGGPLSSVVVRVDNALSTNEHQPLIQSLPRDSEVSFDLILTASQPLSGTIAVVFSSDQGTTARTRVRLQLNVRRPVLIASQSSLIDSIPRGSQKSFQINITNEGDVPATALKVSLPPAEQRISLTAFSNDQGQASEGGLNLAAGETAVLVLTVTTGPEDVLGEFHGTVALNSDLSSASISYRFYVTSLNRMNVTVRVEDEYTYFASDKPLVSGAVVTLRNPRRGYREVRTTKNDTEYVVFEDLLEDRYTLTATAPGHGYYSAVIIAKPSESSFAIFLQRIAVKYTWTVTPTTFQDKYVITLDSTFETRVPMPVVTIDPANVNTIPYEEGKKDVINFNITNHGLIRADNVRLVLPSDHPTLIFTETIDPIGDVDASTSMIVPVKVSLKPRVKRNIVGASVCGLKMLYDYVCGGKKTGGQGVTLSRQHPGRPPLPCSSGGGGGGGGGGGTGGGGGGYVGVSKSSGTGTAAPSTTAVEYNPVTPLTCDCAETLIKKCALEFLPVVGCGMATAGLASASGFAGASKAALDFGYACLADPLSSTLWTASGCIDVIQSNCGGKGPSGGGNPGFSQRVRRSASSELVQGVINRNVAFRNYMIILKELFGGESVFELKDNSWVTSFNLALAEDSPAGSFISLSEITSIVSVLNTTQRDTVERFLTRWNKTMTAWENGTLTSLGPDDGVMSYNVIMTRFEQFKTDTYNSEQRGFDSIFDDFGNSVTSYNENAKKKTNKEEGICAKVRVRIVQELVLTRDAFNAKLELENGEQSALENLNVTVNIRATFGDSTLTNNLFSIGSPKLVGITGVDGSGRLERDVSGTAEWLIIPYSTAAVKEDTLYDVGGTLSYTVDGSDFSIPLLPDTITVKPNPSLIVNYFHEKYIQGDDPMTKETVEPIVPFSLAVMVSNGAYGVARQLKITSAQPEIIENEKGLLVTFKIIGAHLGNNPVAPSLSIDFGDIESFETKTARWLLTSSLKGKFYNYTATFENINPLGDPQLSIMEHLGYHELVHLVRLETREDDLDDFLVNDITDEDELPDAVYDSSNGFYSSPVVATQVNMFRVDDARTTDTTKYIILTVSLTSDLPEIFGYTRVDNNLTRNVLNESLLKVTRDDGKDILIGNNAWTTSYYHDKFYFHLFDHYQLSSFNSTSYSLVFGTKNMHKPVFSKLVFEVVVGVRVQPSVIFTVNASDKDPLSKLTFTLSESVRFQIDELTGEIRNIVPIGIGIYELHVIVKDNGFPVLSSNATVIITVSSEVTTPVRTTSTQKTTAISSNETTGSTSTTPGDSTTKEVQTTSTLSTTTSEKATTDSQATSTESVTTSTESVTTSTEPATSTDSVTGSLATSTEYVTTSTESATTSTESSTESATTSTESSTEAATTSTESLTTSTESLTTSTETVTGTDSSKTSETATTTVNETTSTVSSTPDKVTSTDSMTVESSTEPQSTTTETSKPVDITSVKTTDVTTGSTNIIPQTFATLVASAFVIVLFVR